MNRPSNPETLTTNLAEALRALVNAYGTEEHTPLWAQPLFMSAQNALAEYDYSQLGSPVSAEWLRKPLVKGPVITELAERPTPPSVSALVAALEFYARGDHLLLGDENAWESVTGDPQNWIYHETIEAGVEIGEFAEKALATYRKQGVES